MESPKNVIDSGILPNLVADSVLIDQCSDPQQLIYLSLGETWAPLRKVYSMLFKTSLIILMDIRFRPMGYRRYEGN